LSFVRDGPGVGTELGFEEEDFGFLIMMTSSSSLSSSRVKSMTLVTVLSRSAFLASCSASFPPPQAFSSVKRLSAAYVDSLA
jgi:hypothetical protein